MRNVILYIATSKDGFIADINGGVDFLNEGKIINDSFSYEELMKRIDTVIMGSKTYIQITTELAIGNYPYSDKTSYVLTSKNLEDFDNIHFINTDVIDLIKELKFKKGKDIWIVGGHSIVQPLHNSGLIDEYQITIIDIELKKGIKLFK